MRNREDTARWIDLTGKVAHVTGAGHGIGAGIAAALASAGAHVVVSDIDEARAQAVARDIGGLGMQLDVSRSAGIDRAFQATADRFGGLDIVVNNAGIFAGMGVATPELTDDIWGQVTGVNLNGVFYGCRAAARLMIAAKTGGRIINVSSVQAVTPGAGAAYDSCKAALVQMTRSLALDLARHRINVNAIAPGGVWTAEDAPAPEPDGSLPAPTGNVLNDTIANRIARIPAGRWGRPDDIGKAAVFLASAMSDYVTGIYLPVDGGWLTT